MYSKYKMEVRVIKLSELLGQRRDSNGIEVEKILKYDTQTEWYWEKSGTFYIDPPLMSQD